MDLTSIVDPAGVAESHFLDSWSVAAYLPADARVADLGSGAGFPGLALALLRPDLTIASVEPRKRRCGFQRHVVRTLGLGSQVDVVESRFEDWCEGQELDSVVARAVGEIGELARLAKPGLRRGGQLVAMRGADGQAEAREAKDDLKGLGAEIVAVDSLKLPLTRAGRSIVVAQFL
jgi:16S rRNA (guanine527-N7)-methyltransferase